MFSSYSLVLSLLVHIYERRLAVLKPSPRDLSIIFFLKTQTLPYHHPHLPRSFFHSTVTPNASQRIPTYGTAYHKRQTLYHTPYAIFSYFIPKLNTYPLATKGAECTSPSHRRYNTITQVYIFFLLNLLLPLPGPCPGLPRFSSSLWTHNPIPGPPTGTLVCPCNSISTSVWCNSISLRQTIGISERRRPKSGCIRWQRK